MDFAIRLLLRGLLRVNRHEISLDLNSNIDNKEI